MDSISTPEDLELEAYSFMFISYLHWANRTSYFELIEKFLDNSSYESNYDLDLLEKYSLIKDAGQRLQTELILVDVNEKSIGFSDLLDKLIQLFI